MDRLRVLAGGGLLLASGIAAAHPGLFPHHFFTDPDTPHFWLIGSGLDYVFACVVATVVFFALRHVKAKDKRKK